MIHSINNSSFNTLKFNNNTIALKAISSKNHFLFLKLKKETRIKEQFSDRSCKNQTRSKN